MNKTTQQETDRVDIFMPIYIGDYLKDTNRLSTEQHGAYLLLLFDYWQHGHLPDDDSVLCRIARMTPDAWSNACSILKAYFKKVDGKLVHSRVERELQKAREQKNRYKSRSKKALEARWGNNSDTTSNATSNATSNPQAMLKQCPSPSPSPSPKTSNKETSVFLSELGEERRKLIDEWLRYKKDRRETYKPASVKKLIEKWADFSDAELHEAIDTSISNGWSGLFEPKNKPAPKKVVYTRGF